MSSCLCKKVEGAVFPLWVVAVKDQINDPIYAPDIDETDHGSSAATHLDEAALDVIGGPQLSPQVPGELKEREQLRQVFSQLVRRQN